MEKITALHTAARGFCMEQYAFWVRKYTELQKAEKFLPEHYFSSGWTYSRDAYSLFPRYRLVEATLINIERLSFDGRTPLDEARETLLAAGREALDSLHREFKGKAAAVEALETQARSYDEFVRDASDRPLDEVQPIAYRRVLTKSESEGLWALLKQRWKIRGAGYGWFPLTDDPAPAGALTFHKELWLFRDGHSLLQRFLLKENVFRCFLLRELGPPDFEMDAVLAESKYDGSESFIMTNSDWVLYTSHESSVTLAGSLADFFRHEWSDAEQVGYAGPFHTSDLRGSWHWSY
jgi:hypothetical protein